MPIITVTSENFKTEVLNSPKPVLLDFWATWCPPCMMQSPIIDEIAEQQPMLAETFNVENIPTLVIIKDGNIKSRLVGLHTKEQILAEF